jgi:excisionase family DNA binding protein
MKKVDLTVQEAADELGLHYMTVYRYVRTGRLAASREGSEWRVPRAALAQLEPAARPGRARGGERPSRQRYVRRLVALLERSDDTEAWRLVETALGSTASPEDLYFDVLAPAMRRIGHQWAAGRIDVADEHRATVVMYRLIGRLGPLFNAPGTTRGTIIVGAVPGDAHGLASALVADPLRAHRFTVVDLGANTPRAAWQTAIASTPRLVGVGLAASTAFDDADLAATITSIKQHTDVPVVLGGIAIRDRAHALELHADAYSKSGRAAVAAFDNP